CFTAIAIKRVQTTMRLQRDLRINLPGCALALDLLEELEELRCLSRRR
ncbi:MAG: MerR family transcriptional regulator, partial [Proteobacteria bacterium]|nr:MerR family transcriptional regulator [Pseudomonadota bacterium]